MDIDPGQTGMSELLDALGPSEPQAEPEQGEPQAEQVAQEPEQQQPQEEAAPELVDLDGKKLEIPQGTPPQLVEAVKSMANDLKADHTRKTQAVAEDRRQLEAIAQNIEKRQHLIAATADQWSEMRAAQQRVEQFKALDWQSLADQDPTQATKLMAAFQQAQLDAQTKAGTWQQSLHQLNTLSEQHREKSVAEQWTKASEAARQALGEQFSEKANLAAQEWLVKRANGMDKLSVMSRFGDPVILEAIVKAAQWDAAQGKPMRQAKEAPKVIKPAAPQPVKENQSALERLKKTGRGSELVHFL